MLKLTVFCLVLFTVFLHGNGYEFNDAAFKPEDGIKPIRVVVKDHWTLEFHSQDQLLFSELDDASYIASSHFRVRRDDSDSEEKDSEVRCPHHHWKKIKLCCAQDLLMQIIKEDVELKRECFKEVMGQDEIKPLARPLTPLDPLNCEDINKYKEQLRCVYQCMGQKKKLLDSNGNIMEDALSEHIKYRLSPLKLSNETLDKISETCIKQSKNFMRNTDQSKETCNPVMLQVAHCVFREIQLNCPEDQVIDKEACEKFKEMSKKKSEMKNNFIQPRQDPE